MRSFTWVVAVCALAFLGIPTAGAAANSTTQHSTSLSGFDATISSTDLIHGILGATLPGDNGWHPANTNPADQLAAFTDGLGDLGTGLTGLLNDFPGAGVPTKRVQYDLGGAKNIAEIRVLSGNTAPDGRIFSTTVIRCSTNNGGAFGDLGYFQSDPSGTLNGAAAGGAAWRSTLVTIFDDAGPTLRANVTNLQFDFFSVDNTGGQMRDPYDGLNPYTGSDDTLTAAFVSPRILEIDVIEVPEPMAASLLILGGLVIARIRRRSRS